MYSRTQNENGTYNTRCLILFHDRCFGGRDRRKPGTTGKCITFARSGLSRICLRARKWAMNSPIATRNLNYLSVGASGGVCSEGGLALPSSNLLVEILVGRLVQRAGLVEFSLGLFLSSHRAIEPAQPPMNVHIVGLPVLLPQSVRARLLHYGSLLL